MVLHKTVLDTTADVPPQKHAVKRVGK